MTTSRFRDNADPYFVREVPGETFTYRSTVDHTEDGEIYSCFAMEPSTGDLRQMVRSMSREEWFALGDLCEASVRAIDRMTVVEERRAA